MVIILTGVSGAGKSTVGSQLAMALGWQFIDADDIHPAANKEKMQRGTPLTDTDRWPWLDSIRSVIQNFAARRQDAVVACSALKAAYREKLEIDPATVKFVYLKGDQALIAQRLEKRRDHFMNRSLLRSQFETLEEPVGAIIVDIRQTPGEIAAAVRTALQI
ncbi:MAG: gluconokinase [Candidatus Binataceae bacterium]|nr:gluconokinase [Candidatus Binataceae bacterium]